MLRGLLALLLCAATLISFVGCSKGSGFAFDGSKLVDKKNKVSYEYAPLSYEPMAVSETPYGEGEDVSLYAIEGKDPLKWLTDGDGTVFHASTVKLPGLDEMNISYVEICTEGKESVKVEATVTDAADIAASVGSYSEAQSIYYSGEDFAKSYKIRFADTELGLYYSVLFIRYENDYVTFSADGTEVNHGRDFLFDRYDDKKFVPAPAELVKYIDGLA